MNENTRMISVASKIVALLASTTLLIVGLPTMAYAENNGTATITIASEALSSSATLVNSTNMGINLEMSMISDEMWAGNGNWMEQTFANSNIKIMRWGYDAWVYDWENEIPLLNNYQGGNNTKNDTGTLGLREFTEFCKSNDIIPLVDIPIESYDHRASSAATTGPESLARVKLIAKNMATYLNSCGITEAYFDMGNEPYSYVSCQYGGIPANTYGSLFPEFYSLIKEVNPNYKLILVHQEGAVSWNNTAEAAANNCYDGVDDHQYPRPNGWSNYYSRTDDNIYANGFGGNTPNDKIKIMGECNLPWPNFPEYSTNLGSSLALLNGFLDLANDDYYSAVIMWPSHWPTSSTTANVGNASKPGGWFDTDAWYDSKETARQNGPIYAEMIAQNSVKDKAVLSTSDNTKVRSFVYSNTDNSELTIVVINKEAYNTLDLYFELPAGYNSVSAMVLKGERNASTNSAVETATPVYVSHSAGITTLSGTTFNDSIPYGECAILYTFRNTSDDVAPTVFSVKSPTSGGVIGTAHTFSWNEAAGANDYEFVLSSNADLSSPIIDTYTGGITHYQVSQDLPHDTTLYYTVNAVNSAGVTQTSDEIIVCTTCPQRQFVDDTQTSGTAAWSYSGSWLEQDYLGCFGRGDHVSHTANSTATFTFTGNRAYIYGVRGDWCGMVQVSIDNNAAEILDFYREAPLAQSNALPTQDLLIDTGTLSDGVHQIQVTVLSEKNPAVNGTSYIELDYAEFFDETHPYVSYSTNAPEIVTDLPSSVSYTVDNELILAVAAVSDNPLRYEWYKDGILLSVTTNGVYSVSNPSAEDAGSYYVQVSAISASGIAKTIKSSICMVTTEEVTATPLETALSLASENGFCYIYMGDDQQFDGDRVVFGTSEDISRLKASTKGTLLVRYRTTDANNQVIVAAGKDYATNGYGAILANGVSGVNQIRLDYPDGMYANLSNTIVSDGNWHTFIYSVDATDLIDKAGKTVTSFDGTSSTQYPNFASWYNQNDNINDIQYLTIGGAGAALANSSNSTNFIGDIAFVAFVPDAYTQTEVAVISSEIWNG